MADKKEQPNAASSTKGETRSEDALDQETLDRMLSGSTGGDADQLESMLDALEDPADTDKAETAEESTDMDALADNMEAMLNRMESDEADTTNREDPLYQATLADLEHPQVEIGEVTPPSEGENEPGEKQQEEETVPAEDPFEALVKRDNDEAQDETSLDALLENDEASETEEDLDALLEDSLKETEEAEPEAEEAEETSDEDMDLDALLEDSLEETEEASEEDLDALLQDSLEETKEAEPEAEETEEASEEDLDALLEDSLEEEAKPNGEEATEENFDLDALLEDSLEETEEAEPEAEETEEASEEDLDALLEDSLEEEAKPNGEEATEEDLDALLEDSLEETEEAESEAEKTGEASEEDLDLDALLEDSLEEIEEAESETEEASEEDLDALPENSMEETESAEPGAEEIEEASEEDLDALLEDSLGESEEAESEAGETEEASEEDLDLDALLEDSLEETEEAESEAEEAEEASEEDLDLDALLEDSLEETEEASEEDLDLDALLEDSLEETGEVSEEDLDLDALLEDSLEETEEAEPEVGEIEEASEKDLDALLEDSFEETEEETEEASEEDFDLDALLEDSMEKETEPDGEEASAEDLDALLEDSMGEPESTKLDDLLEGLDNDLDKTIHEGFNVGIEDEVAQILTGKASEDTNILDDFRTVQDTILSEPDLHDDGASGTLLVVDDDPDNRALFLDALSGGDYNFIEAVTPAQAMQELKQRAIDLVLINIDDDAGDTLNLVEEIVSSPELPHIPIIVNSENNDQIEDALKLGAVDYLSRPLGVMDVEFQIPRKVANQLKLRKAERMLAGAETGSIERAGRGDDVAQIENDELDLDSLLKKEDDELNTIALDEDESDGAYPGDLLVGTASGKSFKKGKARLTPVSDQQKLLREHRERRRPPSRLPLFIGIAVLLALLGAVSYYAMDYFKMYLNHPQQASQSVPIPEPSPKVKLPEVPKQDYATSQPPAAPAENVYRRQAEILKGRIRQNVNALSTSGGAWWSPWRIMRQTGGSVSGLVDHRSVEDILNVFGVDKSAVESDLQSEKTLDFLASVGFDLHGKNVDELNARETFELLSARQIKNADQIVEILSKLTDRLAEDRTAQSEQNKRENRERKDSAMAPAGPAVQTWQTTGVVQIAPPHVTNRAAKTLPPAIRGSPPPAHFAPGKT